MRTSRSLDIALLSVTLLGAFTLLGSAAPAPFVRSSVRMMTSHGEVTEPTDPPRNLERIRAQLRRHEHGTYIGEMLAGRDSALARWADRDGVPVRVWVRPTSRIPRWTPAHAEQARSAFAEWNAVGLPVQFAFVSDSTDAEVHLTWLDRFEEPISGRTRWARNDEWWITDAVITLAVHHHQGALLDSAAVRAMALHEIGHLLGLDHTENPGSVMTRRVRVREIADVDRATAQLLYSVPAGSIAE